MTAGRLPKLRGVEDVHVEFRSDVEETGASLWDQVNELLRTSLHRSGFPQPTPEPLQERYEEVERPSLIIVAPGIALQATEYEDRYGGIDLTYYREHMSPELFRAFVRRIGSIKGRPDLDVGEFVDTPQT